MEAFYGAMNHGLTPGHQKQYNFTSLNYYFNINVGIDILNQFLHRGVKYVKFINWNYCDTYHHNIRYQKSC